MRRFACAFVAIIAAFLAGIAYMAVFDDEIDPRNPANLGAGAFAPMYRHAVEYCIIVATTWPTVALAFYLRFGTLHEIEIMRAACRRFFSLHFISGVVLLSGLFIAVAFGQPVRLRDTLTLTMGLGILMIGIWGRAWSHGNSNPIS